MEQQNQQPNQPLNQSSIDEQKRKMSKRIKIVFLALAAILVVIGGIFLLKAMQPALPTPVLQPQSSSEGFGIYLSEDGTLVISDKDIISYNPESYEIKLTEQGVERVESLYNAGRLSQEPFVIKLNGKEMYGGYFFTDAIATSMLTYYEYAGVIMEFGRLFPPGPLGSSSVYITILHPNYPGPLEDAKFINPRNGEEIEIKDPRNNSEISAHFQKLGKVGDTSAWKIYRNEEFGFEMKYPEEVHFSGQFIDFNDEEKVSITLSESPVKALIDIYMVIRRQQTAKKTVHDLTPPLYSQYEKLGIYDALEVIPPEEQHPPFGFRKYILIHDGMEYSFELWITSPEVVDVFSQVLSTFRFIEPIDTSDWQTYRNSEFGFEVRYPQDWIVEADTSFYQVNLKSSKTASDIIILEYENLENLPFDEWMERLSFLADDPLPRPTEEYAIFINGVRAYRFDSYPLDQPRTEIFDIFIESPTNRIFGVHLTSVVEEDRAIVNQILSTFRFVEKGE